ncbi:MAG: translation initiation factor IF-2 subunit alpha [Candidatus Altarchaeum sp.]|nr:translation initiation factor IF-2 subunit alpha [Candidatus Altarchaeum sp.]
MENFPEEGELVLCTIKKTFDQGAYVTIDEYNKEGYLSLKEISLKWIKNIHDYVREKQKVILKVIRVDRERGAINLSLRSVSNAERKAKTEDIKRVQKEEKFIGFVSNELKINKDKIREILKPLEDKYGTIYTGIEKIASDNTNVEILSCEDTLMENLIGLINKNVKAKKVEVSGFVMLKSYDADGVERIKKIFKRADAKNVNITYIGAPIYKIDVFSDEYKTAEKKLKTTSEKILGAAKDLNCTARYAKESSELLQSEK